MIRSVEKTGRTVDEAVQEALEELGLGRDEADIEVLEEPARGILGLVGQRPARVRVTAKTESVEVDVAEKAREFLGELLRHMGFAGVSVSAQEVDGVLRLDVQGKGLGGLIGRRGATLDAVQHLVNLVAGRWMRVAERAGREQEDRFRIVVDAEGYREKRARSLERLAVTVAERVRREGRRATLEPMNPMERRIVHLAVQRCQGVTSFSEGEEPYRRVVIAPKEDEGPRGPQ
ncbi:MAG: protein jag [Firmicutes bacterium]|jgi:spoIIIJ-associated protein|nr:protein jag [Bacillota bacterium]MDH7495859.1 RNA-binding cell elongation regulator Jag/EloR [Bacillota bacterium]